MSLNKNLIKGSFTLILGFGLFNFLNFLFQLVMARMLTVAEYGILATLFAIIYILLIFTESVQTIITKYSAKEKDKGKLKNLYMKSSKKALRVSFFLYILYLAVSIPLSFLLKINYFLLSLNGLVIFLSFFIPISRGMMQGKKRFKALSINMAFESTGKIIFGILFVMIGWRVFGALTGVLLGGVVSYLLSFIPLRDILKSKEVKEDTVGIYDYARPTFFITAVIIVFYSLDVIIAKIFFAPEIAGTYAIASILGKIIFWGTLPISKAMFPMSAESGEKKSGNLFNNALGILILGIAFTLLIFYIFPGFIIQIFSGKILPQANGILLYLGIAFSFIALSNLILLYKLSINKIKSAPKIVYFLLGGIFSMNVAFGIAYKLLDIKLLLYFSFIVFPILIIVSLYSFIKKYDIGLFLFVFIEIGLLSLFSSNLYQFSIAFIASASILLWGSIFLTND
jgi:O-antigen/teichoic acid export membrane protein